jgi:hypothetical protein
MSASALREDVARCDMLWVTGYSRVQENADSRELFYKFSNNFVFIEEEGEAGVQQVDGDHEITFLDAVQTYTRKVDRLFPCKLFFSHRNFPPSSPWSRSKMEGTLGKP